MQCPSCRSEITDNQFYCPVCRASVYSYTPENSPGSVGKSQVGRAGKRLLDLLLLLVLVGAGIVIGRAIKWNELLSNFLPGYQAPSATKPERQPASGPNSSGKQRASEASKDSSKPSGEKSADSTKPASAESVRDLKQKIEELPSSSSPGSSGETKPTPKPTAQPTPKPPSNPSGND